MTLSNTMLLPKPLPKTLPNFLIIGAAKAGTTSLYRYLEQHPQIYMSPIKEPNFFALEGEPLDFRGPDDKLYIEQFSVTERESYGALFEAAGPEQAVGEASALYLYSPQAPARICRYVPGVKMIAVLRHPVDRAYSAFLHLLRDAREPLPSFEAALEAEAVRIRGGWEHIWHLRRMGFYGEQLTRYYRYFGREQIRVYLYEELQRAPEEVIADMFEFLGVDPGFRPDRSVRYNEPGMLSEAQPPVPPAVRQRLLASYRSDILCLQKLIDKDLGSWLT